MSKLIIGNWKLNPMGLNEAVALASGISFSVSPEMYENLVLLPPFIFLEELVKRFKHISWGAQDFFWEKKGAFTGEISLPMLKDVGVEWVLVGHSERRRFFGENDEIVNKKTLSALAADFNTIVAVGELQKDDPEETVVESFKKSIQSASQYNLKRLVVAYEPVWAVGTGEADDPARANRLIGQLRRAAFKMLGDESNGIRFLYGGSVTAENTRKFLGQLNIDGALVGGASLNQEEFVNILKTAQAV